MAIKRLCCLSEAITLSTCCVKIYHFCVVCTSYNTPKPKCVQQPYFFIPLVDGIPDTSWRHYMDTLSVLLALCAGNPPITGGFPAQRPVMRNFDVSFDASLNKLLYTQSKSTHTHTHTLRCAMCIWKLLLADGLSKTYHSLCNTERDLVQFTI